MNTLRVPPRGIKSLNDRLSQLELDHDDNLISRLQKSEKQRKQKELDKLNENFINSMKEHVIDLDKSNLVEILVFGVKYVHQNSTNIARMCSIKSSDEFNTMAVCSLISFLYPEYEMKFLENASNTLKQVLYPEIEDPKPLIIPDIPLAPPEKKKFQLMRRKSKH